MAKARNMDGCHRFYYTSMELCNSTPEVFNAHKVQAMDKVEGKEQIMEDDTIKRSDAIKAVWKPQVKPNESIFDALKTAIESEINNVPSADRPQGEWIKKPHKVYLPGDYEPDIIDYRDHQYNEEDHSIIQYWWHCNQCDYEAGRGAKPTANFCPNCGAKMKGADDD